MSHFPCPVYRVPQVSLLTPGKVRLFSITPSLRAGAIECSLAQLRSSGAGRVAQVRALVLGANPSTPLRAGSGIRNILSGPPCACLSRSRAVHSDSISTTPFFSQRRMTETAPLPISRFQDQPPLHWIAMNITQLLAKLALLAVIVALLPKCRLAPKTRARTWATSLFPRCCIRGKDPELCHPRLHLPH